MSEMSVIFEMTALNKVEMITWVMKFLNLYLAHCVNINCSIKQYPRITLTDVSTLIAKL